MNVTMKRNSNIGNVSCLACHTFRLHIPAHDSTSFEVGSHNRITERDSIGSWPAWELDLKKVPCRCPKLVAGRISLLIAHLGGKAYSLRSAIITAIGHLVQKAFENAPGEDADAQGAPCIHILISWNRESQLPCRPLWELPILHASVVSAASTCHAKLLLARAE